MRQDDAELIIIWFKLGILAGLSCIGIWMLLVLAFIM